MAKYKSIFLLGLLLGVAWLATFIVVDPVERWASLAKVETPQWFGGGEIAPSLPMLVFASLVLWLTREQWKRTFAVLGAVASLLFCVLSVQTALWYAMLLHLTSTNPALAATYDGEMWIQIIGANVAFTLSALCLWLCARAAGPKQPRPLSSWREWLSWNGVRAVHSESV